MSRLYRPSIPLDVKLTVALRQCGYDKDTAAVFLATNLRHYGYALREIVLPVLAMNLRCTVAELRLDHDPPLAARPRYRRGLGKKTYYQPDANDPAHLRYRPHAPEHDGSHLIKTNVRGDHGQFPDRVLINRERKRREKGKKKRPKQKIRSRSNWPAKGTRKLRSRR